MAVFINRNVGAGPWQRRVHQCTLAVSLRLSASVDAGYTNLVIEVANYKFIHLYNWVQLASYVSPLAKPRVFICDTEGSFMFIYTVCMSLDITTVCIRIHICDIYTSIILWYRIPSQTTNFVVSEIYDEMLHSLPIGAILKGAP